MRLSRQNPQTVSRPQISGFISRQDKRVHATRKADVLTVTGYCDRVELSVTVAEIETFMPQPGAKVCERCVFNIEKAVRASAEGASA
jgi:hypothetical protein